MDPVFISLSEWSDLGRLLTFFWGVLLFIIGFGGSLLLAHAFIPSLVGTGHLPQGVLRVRPVLYATAFISLGIAALFFFNVVTLSDVAGRVWPTRWWY